MSISWFITNFIAAFLLPPLVFLLPGFLGLLLLRRRRALGKALVGFSLAGLWVLSLPVVANAFLDTLKPPPLALKGDEADAIIVLGGGRTRDSVEFGGDTLSRYSLERIRYGAWLAKRLNKPILVTGGAPDGGDTSEGEIMRNALANEFSQPVRWVENRSINTRENALFSLAILKAAHIERIYLVTHAWHLPRAIPEFERLGLKVVPAGTGYSLKQAKTPLDFLPSAGALQKSHLAMHEWIGLLWYRIRN